MNGLDLLPVTATCDRVGFTITHTLVTESLIKTRFDAKHALLASRLASGEFDQTFQIYSTPKVTKQLLWKFLMPN